MSKGSQGSSDQTNQEAGVKSSQTRSTAEWVTLAISVTLVFGLVALTIFNELKSSAEPAIIGVEFVTEEIWQANERYYLPLSIRNHGGEPASDVTVEITLIPEDGEEQTGEVTITFLDVNETSSSVVTFDSDPTQGELSVSSLSFIQP